MLTRMLPIARSNTLITGVDVQGRPTSTNALTSGFFANGLPTLISRLLSDKTSAAFTVAYKTASDLSRDLGVGPQPFLLLTTHAFGRPRGRG